MTLPKFDIFPQVELTENEKDFLQQKSKEVIEQILKKNSKL